MPTSRKISSSFFAIVLICFFLPFITISCDRTPVLELSGIQMTTGTTVETPSFARPAESKKIPADGKAIFAFACCAVGLGSSLIKQTRNNKVLPACAGGLGAFLILSIKSGLDQELTKQGAGYVGFNAEYGLGFWGAFIFFLAAALYNVWQIVNPISTD